MVVETLTGMDFPPEESAVLAKGCGARPFYLFWKVKTSG